MINAPAAYKSAVVADTRQILLRAILEIIDPDIVYSGAVYSGAAPWSKSGQIYDKEKDIDARYATLEPGRWLLDGTVPLLPENPAALTGNVGFVSSALSGTDGTFIAPPWVELRFQNVSILQACAVFFPTDAVEGVPVDFTVEVKSGGTAYYTRKFSGNTASSVSLEGFTVNYPDAIRVTVSKWSLPQRRMRVAEIIPGVYERWDGNIISEFSVKHQGDVSCLTLPYGTCTMTIDNQNKRFEPRNKSGIFKSIEDRQGIPVMLGVRTDDGDIYMPGGVFYQHSGGWSTSSNSLTMQWNLVDIVGLLADREFIPPETLPTTLEGWTAAVVAQLGENFTDRYTVDGNYSALPLTVRAADDVRGMTCGDILRYICMATGTWPRADAETGYLAIEPLWSSGNKVTLDNLESYPGIKANGDVAALIFTLNDGADARYTVSGTTTASGDTQSITNPFIKTEAQAISAAKTILSTFGGNIIELIGRGDMSSEIGDVDTVWLDESSATSARRIMQELRITGGVLKSCASTLLQADGVFLYEDRVVITKDGTWTAPSDADKLRVILIGGGDGGNNGTDGTWEAAGADGAPGAGARIYSAVIDIEPGQSFSVAIGRGGAAGSSGGDTVFGTLSSAAGARYEYGYTDISGGETYGRTGVIKPISGTGDGGAGGAGGVMGRTHKEYATNIPVFPSIVVDVYPGEGADGTSGADGCVVVYIEKGGK